MAINIHQRALKHLGKADPVLAGIIKRANIKALLPRRNHFQSLVVAIINQQLSGKAAATIEKRFRGLFGNKFPKADDVLKISDSRLRSCGLSFQKISYIKNLAEAATNKSLDFRKLSKLQDEIIINQLIQIKGIGRWTAEMFLMFSLGRPNVFSMGDLGLRNGLKKLYNIDTKKHSKKLQKLLDSWHPHKTLASRLLWASVDME